MHAYAAPGTYTARVTVADGFGNAAGSDVTIVVKAAQATLATARFSAKWKQSRVAGTLRVAGTAPIAGKYDIDVTKGKTRRLHVRLSLTAAAFTRTLKLPVKFPPGTYRVSLLPVDSLIGSATRQATLAAPAEGVVDVAALSRTRTGKAVRSLTATGTVWARFHFVAVPKGKVTLTWYRIAKGKRSKLTSSTTAAKANVRGSLSLRGRNGTITRGAHARGQDHRPELRRA